MIPYLKIDSEWWWILQRSTSAPKRTESSTSLLYSLLAATIVTDTKGERVVEKHAGDHSDQAFVDRSSSKGFRSELQFYTKRAWHTMGIDGDAQLLIVSTITAEFNCLDSGPSSLHPDRSKQKETMKAQRWSTNTHAFTLTWGKQTTPNTPKPATARRQGGTDDFCRLGITPQQQQQQQQRQRQQNIYFKCKKNPIRQ